MMITLDQLLALEGTGSNQVVRNFPLQYSSAPLMLFGQNGCGKTAFAMALMLHLAAGKPFLHYPIKTSHNIVFLDLDGNRLGATTQKLIRGFGLDFDFKRVSFEDPRAEKVVISKPNDPKFLQYYHQWVDSIREATGIKETILVADTLNCLIPNADENSAEMGPNVKTLQRLSLEDPSNALAIMYTHHQGYSQRHSRGSTSIISATNAAVKIEETKGAKGSSYKVIVERDRIHPVGGYPELHFKFNDLEHDEEQRPTSTRIDSISANENPVELVARIKAYLQTSEKPLTAKVLARGLSKGDAAVLECLKEMVTSGVVQEGTQGKAKVYHV